MAKSKSHGRYKKRFRSNPETGSGPRPNPPLFQDLADWIGPGFVGFAATRLLTRIAATQIGKRKPTLGKHAGAIASVGTFLASWLLAQRVKFLAKYQMPLVVGSGIAAAQSLLQLYVPRLGWTVSDATPELTSQSAQTIRIPANVNAADLEPLDDEDPNLYTYSDSYDAGRMSHSQVRADQHAPAAPPRVSDDDDLSDLDLDELSSTDTMGIFGGSAN